MPSRAHRRPNYPDVGATAREPLPAGYHQLRRTRVLGHGAALFDRAATDLLTWQVHRRARVFGSASSARAEPGSRIALRAGLGPFHLDAHCEVVYVLDEPRRRGFAYGTLDGHPESGEERFVVEHRADDTVVYSIVAFSRPATFRFRLVAPVARIVQARITDRYLAAL